MDYSLGYLISLLITLVPIGLVCWAVWRGAYRVKLLVIVVSLCEFARPLFHFSKLQVPGLTPQFVVLTVALIPWIAAVILDRSAPCSTTAWRRKPAPGCPGRG